jgi:hypothetical protein
MARKRGRKAKALASSPDSYPLDSRSSSPPTHELDQGRDRGGENQEDCSVAVSTATSPLTGYYDDPMSPTAKRAKKRSKVEDKGSDQDEELSQRVERMAKEIASLRRGQEALERRIEKMTDLQRSTAQQVRFLLDMVATSEHHPPPSRSLSPADVAHPPSSSWSSNLLLGAFANGSPHGHPSTNLSPRSSFSLELSVLQSSLSSD